MLLLEYFREHVSLNNNRYRSVLSSFWSWFQKLIRTLTRGFWSAKGRAASLTSSWLLVTDFFVKIELHIFMSSQSPISSCGYYRDKRSKRLNRRTKEMCFSGYKTSLYVLTCFCSTSVMPLFDPAVFYEQYHESCPAASSSIGITAVQFQEDPLSSSSRILAVLYDLWPLF